MSERQVLEELVDAATKLVESVEKAKTTWALTLDGCSVMALDNGGTFDENSGECITGQARKLREALLRFEILGGKE